jgi:hypothetical protein
VIVIALVLGPNAWGLRAKTPILNSPNRVTAAAGWVVLALIGIAGFQLSQPEFTEATAKREAAATATAIAEAPMKTATAEAKSAQAAIDARANTARAEATASARRASATSEELALHVPMGTTMSTKEWDYTVTGFEDNATVGSFRPQGKYVVVYMTIKNNQAKQDALQDSLTSKKVILYDNKGNEYGIAEAAPSQVGVPFYTVAESHGLRRYNDALLPSLAMNTALVFDVVPDASSYQLGTWNSAKRRLMIGE